MALKKILCCTDFSENAEAAFHSAFEMAEKYQAKLYVVHALPPVVNPMLTGPEWVVTDEPVKSIILKIEEKMQKEYGQRLGDRITHELVVLDGHVSSEIIKFIEEKKIELVILGAYGLSGMGLVVFGSVAKRVAHKAPCSVMIVRH